MARFTGPRRRIIRRLGTELPGLTTRTQEGREYPPGQHGGLARRRRPSEYAIRLREKQKLRMYYGLTERQMRTAAKKAAAGRGITGQELLRGLESRLDNAVFRLGLAATIPAARQLVRHGHIMVDGKRATFPSEGLHTGARVEVEPGSRKLLPIAEAIAVGPRLRVPSWLRRDDDGLGGVVVTSPPREDVPFEVRENLVVEFYAR